MAGKGKNKQRNTQVADESQSSQASQSQSQSIERLSIAEFNRKVSDMVRYLLCSDHKKLGMKRADIVKNVMKEHSRTFTKVFEEASKQLLDIFGYEVVEMESDGKAKGYILVNAVEKGNDSENLINWGDESTKMGLLLVILSMIFMNENTLTETSLWHTLQKFGIKKDKGHKVYGDVDKLVNQEYVRQNYLERTKIQGPEGPTFNYHMGARSLKEIPKRKILQFVSEVSSLHFISYLPLFSHSMILTFFK